MDDVLANGAEHVNQHVEEMHADIGRNARRATVSSPFHEAPYQRPAGGDVGQIHTLWIRPLPARSIRALRAFTAGWRRSCRMLKMRLPVACSISAKPSMFQGFRTSGFSQIASASERRGEPAMRIMKIVRRAYAEQIDRPSLAVHQVYMPIESLELGKEVGVGKEGIDDSHRVVGIESGVQHTADVRMACMWRTAMYPDAPIRPNVFPLMFFDCRSTSGTGTTTATAGRWTRLHHPERYSYHVQLLNSTGPRHSACDDVIERNDQLDRSLHQLQQYANSILRVDRLNRADEIVKQGATERDVLPPRAVPQPAGALDRPVSPLRSDFPPRWRGRPRVARRIARRSAPLENT